MKKFALVKQGQIQNTIVAEDSFLPVIAADWDHIVEVTETDYGVGIGWSYDPDNKVFVEPAPETPEQIAARGLSIDEKLAELDAKLAQLNDQVVAVQDAVAATPVGGVGAVDQPVKP